MVSEWQRGSAHGSSSNGGSRRRRRRNVSGAVLGTRVQQGSSVQAGRVVGWDGGCTALLLRYVCACVSWMRRLFCASPGPHGDGMDEPRVGRSQSNF